MELKPGDKLGRYQLVSPIGAGGMGEVWKARDTQLGRDVALKVSKDSFTARFNSEARAIAAFNHPNICQIYDVGLNFLVMELTDGVTLKGPLPVEKAVAYAGLILDALDAAHRKGFTHRDLKPANVLVTKQGVKLLDFGLAKQNAVDGRPDDETSAALTKEGQIVGTLQYMAPEQLQGKEADARSDIFAFGCVLYEMLSGSRAFAGTTGAGIIAAIMYREPEPLKTTPPLDRVIRKCLMKDPEERFQNARDLKYNLVLAMETGVSAAPPVKARVPWIPWIAAAVLAVVAGGASSIAYRASRPAEQTPMRFRIDVPEKTSLVGPPAISPNGRYLALNVNADKQNGIWIRSLDTLEARRLPDSESFLGPTLRSPLFWSHDSRLIAFSDGHKLKKIEASGGPAQTICDLSAELRGGAWAPDGSIIISTSFQPLMRVPNTGGAPVPLTFLSPGAGDATDLNPWFLPDGRHFLYARGSAGAIEGGIYAGSLDDKPEKQSSHPLLRAEYPNAPVYVPSSSDAGTGYVLFTREGSLVAVPFNARRLQVTGDAVRVANGIVPGYYSASGTGTLALTEKIAGSDNRLLWFDRQGKELGQIGPTAPWSNVQLAPNGKLLVSDRLTNNGFEHIWTADLARGVLSHLNPGEISDYAPVISPDGRVAFTRTPDRVAGDIYVKLASGAGTAEPLVKSALMKHPNHWSLDGLYVVYDEHTAQRQEDLWIVPVSRGNNGAGDRKPVPFLATPADETEGSFSPDTKWIAYSSDESGRHEVYVQGFVPDHNPAAGIGKWQISNAGGAKPRWRRDGKEMYYINGSGELMAVPIKSTATTFEAGVPAPLFQTHPNGYFPYDVAPDGRFVIDTADEGGTAGSITLVLNWMAGLKK